jgi:hypothetical protein
VIAAFAPLWVALLVAAAIASLSAVLIIDTLRAKAAQKREVAHV